MVRSIAMVSIIPLNHQDKVDPKNKTLRKSHKEDRGKTHNRNVALLHRGRMRVIFQGNTTEDDYIMALTILLRLLG